ncbi:MAG: discoidin domain-containing protein [Collinsella intestinalis]|uniref:O-GlcNAcase NagJ n=1 Tax=Collinsella intestinalis TaxID=147207 RepID=A0A6N3BUP1_9ACTN
MKMQRWKRVTARCLLLLCAAAIALPAQAAHADEVNLALNKSVEVTKEDKKSGKRLVDGDKTKAGRWMTEAPAAEAHSAIVDLQKVEKVNYFEITWEDATNCGADFKLYASKDKVSWGAPIKEWKGNTGPVTRLKLDAPVDAQFIKLEITRMNGAYGVSVAELEVWNIAGESPSPAPEQQTPETNIARKAKVATSSNEDGNLTGEKAIDGNTSARESRWATKTGARPAWIQLDFGSTRDVKTFRVYWETRKPKSVKFQYADGESAPVKDSEWTTAKETGRPSKKTQTVSLEKAVKARYVRVLVEDWDALDPDGGVEWDNISMHELEVYGGDLEKTLDDWLSEVTVDPVTPETKKLSYDLPAVPEGYEIKYNGTDYEQVIDADGTIYRPICDVTVKASFKISSKADPSDYAFKEFDVKVPGSMTAAGANAAPVVLPELREWVGGSGSFAASTAKHVVYGDASLKAMAEDFANDYQALTGVRLQVATGTSAQEGDIFFTLGADKAKGLKDEGYLLDVTADRMTVTAEAVAGANWGGKTILQGMKSGSGSFPLGTARDYPLYKVRGIILDVGRKTFTLDWLKQMTKQMSFYKMNDFQIHLNDNLIPLEHYKNEDVFQAYSAFRLESDIKKGGNNGKNQADLTAKDVWYSKKDFKAYIEESKALGVNIIPEIDTPAHSLALTKVRPDLRHGTSGRQNDHLDIAKQYDECFKFVRGIFDEYVKGGDAAVFAGADTIHVGADEYTADGNAYRKFVNDMFKYSEDNGKKARVWGSLSTIKGDVEVKGVSEDGKHHREMNLWNPGWADLKKMYELGFDLIDCQDGVFYIVPNAGYYYDYLGDAAYTDQLNSISGVAIPAGDPQMVGGAYAVWNDMCDYLENGVSEYDIYDRIDHSLGLFAANSWGKGKLDTAGAKAVVSKLGDSPNVDFGYEVSADKNGVVAHWAMDSLKDASELGRDLVAGKNAAIEDVDGKKALKLNGGESFASVKDDALTTVGLGNDLRVKVKRTSASVDPQVLFESDYGSIMAVQEGTGKVGFTRENRAYSFNYTLPVNEWVELEIKNKFEQASLYVNGTLVDTLGDGETVEGKPLKATLMLPVQRIGSTARAFEGYVDDVRLGGQLPEGTEFSKTMDLEYAILNAEAILAEQGNGTRSMDTANLRALISQAHELLKQYNPAQAEVDALLAKINGEIEQVDYAKADYCRIDAYAQLLGSKELEDMFTEQSVAELKAAWTWVRRDLPASMQGVVDGHEQAIVNALNGLELKAAGDLSLIDRTTLKAEANSEQGGEEAAKAIDGDVNTKWHSKWGNENAKLPYTFDLKAKNGEPMAVNGLVYTPRPDGGNGVVTGYKVEVSKDGTSFEKVAEGKLADNAEVKTISFDRVEARSCAW